MFADYPFFMFCSIVWPKSCYFTKMKQDCYWRFNRVDGRKKVNNKLFCYLYCVASLCCKAPAKRSQHSAQHIPTLLGATCCARLATLLRHVACCWLKFEAGQIWANNTQHVATFRNTVAKRTQHVAPNNVAICCVGMLRSFGRGLRLAHSQWVKLNYKRDLQIVVHLLSLSFYKVRVRVTIFFVFKKESYFKIHVACVSSGGVMWSTFQTRSSPRFYM